MQILGFKNGRLWKHRTYGNIRLHITHVALMTWGFGNTELWKHGNIRLIKYKAVEK